MGQIKTVLTSLFQIYEHIKEVNQFRPGRRTLHRCIQGPALHPTQGGRCGGRMYFCSGEGGATGAISSVRIWTPGKRWPGQEGKILAVPGERGGGGLQGGEYAPDTNGLQLLAR